MEFPRLNFDYANPQQCCDLLASVPLTNLDHARDALVQLIRGMLATPPEPLAHLQVLEQARRAVSFVVGEVAKRYSFQPLPPALQENDLLLQVVSLLQAMAHSYSEVASRGGEQPGVQSRLAVICQRCIHYSGRVILEHFRARREIPPGLWIDLHGYYATAEEWGIAGVRVVEPMKELHPTESCQDAYSAILLVDLANPYGRTPREFVWVVTVGQSFRPGLEHRPAHRRGGRTQVLRRRSDARPRSAADDHVVAQPDPLSLRRHPPGAACAATSSSSCARVWRRRRSASARTSSCRRAHACCCGCIDRGAMLRHCAGFSDVPAAAPPN